MKQEMNDEKLLVACTFSLWPTRADFDCDRLILYFKYLPSKEASVAIQASSDGSARRDSRPKGGSHSTA
jgi:hypothetical protein